MPRSAQLPPLSPRFDQRTSFYRLAFLDDGFPGVPRDDGSITPHPMYGVYVLKDYLDQHRRAPGSTVRDAIRIVAEAAVDRMERFRDTLVFWYEPDIATAARLHTRHYSGLTQAYYALVMWQAGDVLGDARITRAARDVAASLTVPATDGGVLYRDEHGLSFAEVPDEPNPYILNGWLSILVWLEKYARTSGEARYAELVRESAATVEQLLPRYDLPDLANSRYGLTGFQYVRLRFHPGDRASLEGVWLLQAGRRRDVPLRDASRWQNYVLTADVTGDGEEFAPKDRTVRMNLVLSLATSNELLVRFTEQPRHPVALDLHVGRYDPLSTAPVDGSWTEVDQRQFTEVDAAFVLPDDVASLVAYPTNFKKRMEDDQVNVYHPLHVFRLRELSRQLEAQGLGEWARRWADYICRWDRMPLYDGLMTTDPSRRGHGPPARWCGETAEGES